MIQGGKVTDDDTCPRRLRIYGACGTTRTRKFTIQIMYNMRCNHHMKLSFCLYFLSMNDIARW